MSMTPVSVYVGWNTDILYKIEPYNEDRLDSHMIFEITIPSGLRERYARAKAAYDSVQIELETHLRRQIQADYLP